jgi:hypothetical protein
VDAGGVWPAAAFRDVARLSVVGVVQLEADGNGLAMCSFASVKRAYKRPRRGANARRGVQRAINANEGAAPPERTSTHCGVPRCPAGCQIGFYTGQRKRPSFSMASTAPGGRARWGGWAIPGRRGTACEGRAGGHTGCFQSAAQGLLLRVLLLWAGVFKGMSSVASHGRRAQGWRPTGHCALSTFRRPPGRRHFLAHGPGLLPRDGRWPHRSGGMLRPTACQQHGGQQEHGGQRCHGPGPPTPA